MQSHPTWVRGLKSLTQRECTDTVRSHPTWVRGLKFLHGLQERVLLRVAPHVGAWIEIR